MLYNPSYMNPIMKGLNMGQPQQPMQTPEQAPTQTPQQAPTQQYDFSGWGDRLNKIEEGIAGLTNQFNNFQTPGDVAPEYTGNPAPNPLDPPKIDPKWGGGKAMPLPDLTGPPGELTKIGGPKIIDPSRNFSPYQRNEDLDLTNRAGIMGEYSNYLQGGHGTQGPMPAMSRMGQFMGEEQSVNYANDFGTFLDTFGIRDRLQFPEQQMFKQSPVGGEGITSLAQNNQGPGI
tara:strand:+ start:417 stop:1109 length:693 start_codon:yes stop_codon:yes gene_type:complete